jgi:hypothetical protein
MNNNLVPKLAGGYCWNLVLREVMYLLIIGSYEDFVCPQRNYKLQDSCYFYDEEHFSVSDG